MQVAKPLPGGLLLLGRERLLGGEFGLEVGDARVLGLDHVALVADAPLALLQLDLELGQLRLALVQGHGAVRELLLGADVLVVGVRALLQLVAQCGLAGLRCLELVPEGLHVRADDRLGRLAPGGPCGQLEAQLHVRGALRLGGLCPIVTLPPAL